MDAHEGAVTALAVAGASLASGGADGVVKVWEEAAVAVPTAGGIAAIARQAGGQRPDWRQAKGAAADRKAVEDRKRLVCSHTYALKAAATGSGGGGGGGGGAGGGGGGRAGSRRHGGGRARGG